MFCRSVRGAPYMARGLLVRFVVCLPDRGVLCFVGVFVVRPTGGVLVSLELVVASGGAAEIKTSAV